MMMIFIGTLFCNLHRDANGLYLRQERLCGEERLCATHMQRWKQAGRVGIWGEGECVLRRLVG